MKIEDINTSRRPWLKREKINLGQGGPETIVITVDINNPAFKAKIQRTIKERKNQAAAFLNLRYNLIEKDETGAEVSYPELLKWMEAFTVNNKWDTTMMLLVVEYVQTVTDWDEAKIHQMWNKLEQNLIQRGLLKKGGLMNSRDMILKRGEKIGIKKGREQCQKKIILNMLKEKISSSLIAKVTKVSEKEIKMIGLKLVK